jgi:hypothetical protein
MTKGSRIAGVFVGVAIVAALIAFYIVSYVANKPQAVAATRSGNGAVSVTFMTVASFGHVPHPDWVSYMVKNPQGKWVHSTIVNLPANTTVHVTILNYDGATGLRNPFWAKPRGVTGYAVDGKKLRFINYNSTSHTFTVPSLGITVPIVGVGDAAPNPCSVTACTLGMTHRTITFSFRTPAKHGQYRWQCFVPCAAGYQNGFGGPMQTVGYMDGYLNVS